MAALTNLRQARAPQRRQQALQGERTVAIVRRTTAILRSQTVTTTATLLPNSPYATYGL
jgi:hypothetical protein